MAGASGLNAQLALQDGASITANSKDMMEIAKATLADATAFTNGLIDVEFIRVLTRKKLQDISKKVTSSLGDKTVKQFLIAEGDAGPKLLSDLQTVGKHLALIPLVCEC